MNDGAGKFREVSAAVGGALDLDSRSIAYADFDNNGTLDLIVANQNGPVKFYKNHQSAKNNWIAFKLKGSKSNASAIGAVATLYWNGKQKKMVISGGDSFSSQSQRTLHFGVGEAEKVDKIVIRWPSGIVQELISPDINFLHTITEPIDA